MSKRMMADNPPKVNGVDSIELIEQFLRRPIAFHRVFVRVTKSVNAALMLSQAYYWKDKGHDPDGWFYKTQAEWKEETGLSRYEQESARKVLRATKFWEERKRGIPGKMYFRVNTKALFEAIQVAAADNSN
ncbi:MAG TPA: hypothetical protein VKA60_20970 [Blastocatellia bacterium]|nr:hypothetical protein [Blastocatellia bacterium]